ncbi:hypothetical protein GUITHDRAFT_56098, partial [Guillardia theta CCMP2712]
EEESLVAATTVEGSLVIWNLEDDSSSIAFQERAEMLGHEGKVTGCKLRTEMHTALTSSEDFTLKVWDIRRGIYKSFEAQDEVLDCCFIPNGTRLLGVCKDGKIVVWDARREDRLLLSIDAHDGWATCCDVTEDGLYGLTGGSDKLAKVWDLRGGKLIQALSGH